MIMSDDNIEYLDDEERELIESIEKTPIEEFERVSEQTQQQIREAARAFVQSEQTRMNIRISKADLERIKERAAREGLKYQSLIKSVLHKYVTDQLVESSNRSR
jgi:predicted DNA binding CopG/RHH family protein